MNKETRFYYDSLKFIKEVSPTAAQAIVKELEDQRSNLKLIASENYSSLAVQATMGNLLNDKYAEGYPQHRYYAGCGNVDTIESHAARLAEKIFGADYAYVQPHCGADANMIAYWAILDHKCLVPSFDAFKEMQSLNGRTVKNYSDMTSDEWNALRELCHNQKLLSMDYYSGSHLTHGYRQNISSQLFDCYYYGVDDNGRLNYDKIEKQAMEVRPLIFLVGYSAYTRKIDFRRMREIADKCGAVLMVDMAHFAGLVAGKVYTNEFDPVKWADVVTSTTHKTLRGPRGGIVLCKKEYENSVNKGCPLVMGGPLPQMMAAKDVALSEIDSQEFRDYAHKVSENSQLLAKSLMERQIHVLTGGTDNHMVIVDVSPFGLNGRQAEQALHEIGICCNRQAIPNDPNGPWYTSGIRIGVPAITTLGMGKKEIDIIAHLIFSVLGNAKPVGKSKVSWSEPNRFIHDKEFLNHLLKKFPVYKKINLKKLKRLVGLI